VLHETYEDLDMAEIVDQEELEEMLEEDFVLAMRALEAEGCDDLDDATDYDDDEEEGYDF
jgi:hypothetical protein